MKWINLILVILATTVLIVFGAGASFLSLFALMDPNPQDPYVFFVGAAMMGSGLIAVLLGVITLGAYVRGFIAHQRNGD